MGQCLHKARAFGTAKKQAIKLSEDDPDLNIVVKSKLTPSDWDLLPKVIALFGPINAASKAVESDTAAVANIIPFTKMMKIELSPSFTITNLSDERCPAEQNSQVSGGCRFENAFHQC